MGIQALHTPPTNSLRDLFELSEVIGFKVAAESLLERAALLLGYQLKFSHQHDIEGEIHAAL